MNNQTEQEFFNTFDIPRKSQCKHSSDCDKCKECFIGLKYPPITPEIVLQLINIIVDKYNNIGFQKWYRGKKIGDKENSKIFYECLCGSELEIFDSRPVELYYPKYAEGETKQQALLKLCIQLKDEIQEQVKELFQ